MPALVALAPPRTAQAVGCIGDPLGPAVRWTLVIHGDLVQANSDSEGRIAVGGDATLTNFGVTSRLPVDGSRVDLAVGGDLDATNAASTTGASPTARACPATRRPPTGPSPASSSIDAFIQEVQRRADGWKKLKANGKVNGPKSGALTMRGTDGELNVFRVRARRLEQAQRILICVPFGSSTLVNVRRRSYSTATLPTVSLEFWDGDSYVQLGDQAPSDELEELRRSLLWNFAGATAVQIGPSLAWHGSVLAPRAAFSFPGGTQLNGTIIAGSLRGNGESHLHPPDSICLPDIGTDPPDPPVEPPDPPDPPVEPPDPGDPDPVDPDPVDPTEPEIPTFPDGNGGGEPGGGGGVLPGGSERTRVGIRKQALDRRGRPVNWLETRPGRRVRFRVWIYKVGFASARRVVVCDRFPRALEYLRASGDPTARGGRLRSMDTQREAIVTFRVRPAVCGAATNRADVRSANGGRGRDTAGFSACLAPPVGRG